MFKSDLPLYLYAAAVAACIAVAALRALGRRLARRGAALRPDEPQCGTCGYIVRPGGPTVCPECGQDVRVRGLLTASTSPRSGAGPAYALMLLLPIPLALLLGNPVARCQPFGWNYSVSRFIYPQGDPRVHGYHNRFVVQASGNGRYFAKAPEFVMAYGMNWPRATAEQPALVVRSRDGVIQRWDAERSRLEYVPFTRERVRAWLDAYDDGLKGVDRAALAATIHEHVADLAAGRFGTTDESDPVHMSSIHYGPQDVTKVVVPALCYAAIAAALMSVLRLNLRRADARLARQWRAEAARLQLVEPPGPPPHNRLRPVVPERGGTSGEASRTPWS